MKYMKKLLLIFILGLGLFSSCKKEDDINPADAANITGLGGDTWVKGPIDNWIYDTLTVPYNISVKYKWDQFEDLGDLAKTLVPPREEYVIPILSAIKKVWINNYVAEAGDLFFKRLTPKFFYLIGSPAYEPNNAIKLGFAEGGRKITLLDINRTRVKGMAGYSKSDSNAVKRMFQTIHHEFGHILHQNIKYPTSYNDITPAGLYTAEWINYTNAQARADGFITAYSMNVVDDDFVEMIAIMLIEGKDGFERLLAAIPNATTARGTTKAVALSRLRAKESAVVTYFKQAWNIDFYKLQARTRASIESLIY